MFTLNNLKSKNWAPNWELNTEMKLEFTIESKGEEITFVPKEMVKKWENSPKPELNNGYVIVH